MAGFNPFKKFRIYQKYALAALGIMAMISFVILPSYFMLQRSGGPTGAEGIIATSRRYGNVDQYLLQNLRENHRALAGFYNLLAGQLAQMSGSSSVWDFYGKYPLLAQIQQTYRQGVSDENLITSWLLTRYAQEKGMVVPNNLIAKRLQTISSGDISNQMLDSVCQQLGLSDSHLTYLLQEEMLAFYMQNSFFRSTVATTPLDRWMLYQRVSRSLTAEVAAIPVESFQKEVKEPSEAELKKFFEENKNRVYNPILADSGFEIPTKFAFQVIDVTPSEQLLASITDEEIKNYYEENKATMFLRQTNRPQSSQGPSQRPGSLPSFDSMFPTIPGGSRPGGLLPGVDSLPGPGLNTPPTGLNLELGAPTEQSPVEPPLEPEETLEFPEEVQPAPAEPDPTPAEEQVEEPSDPQSQLVSPTVYRPVAYRQEEGDGSQQTADGSQEQTADEAETPKSEDYLNVLYQPLAEVENTIRQILAYQKAEAAVKEIEKKMKEFYAAYTISKSKTAEPVNLETLAAEHLMNAISVEQPLSVYEVQQHESWRNPANRPFLTKMFSENSSPFEVLLGQQTSSMFPSGGMTESIGWVTKKEARRIPEFADEGIKELVRDRWLAVAARELAEKHAKKLAELANQSKDQPLAESLADQDVSVVETGSFTWFTRSLAQTGYERAQLLFGEVCEKEVPHGTADYNNVHIKAPGVDFMETAYSLQPGESGVAMNQPQTLAFVIRIIESSPDEETLWKFFVTAPPMDYFGAGKEESQRELMRNWVEEIERNVGFKWVNRPQARQSREED